jgi:hypothetical protein
MSNVKVAVTPFPREVPAIIACGYTWAMGMPTERVVSEEDAKALEAESKRTVKNPQTKKMETRSRFSFTRLGETDQPVDKKLAKQIGLAETSFDLKSDIERQNEFLQKNLIATQEVLKEIKDALRSRK